MPKPDKVPPADPPGNPNKLTGPELRAVLEELEARVSRLESIDDTVTADAVAALSALRG